jgi:hypothetical protein
MTVPFGQDPETKIREANKLIKMGLFALVSGFVIAFISAETSDFLVGSPMLFILGLGSLVVGLVRRARV